MPTTRRSHSGPASRSRLTRPAAACATAAALLLAAGPASAEEPADDEAASGDCVSVTLYYRVGDGDNEYVLGPDHCLVGTPWPEFVWVGGESGDLVPVTVGVGVGIVLPD